MYTHAVARTLVLPARVVAVAVARTSAVQGRVVLRALSVVTGNA